MDFLLFLLFIFVVYVAIRYHETTLPLIKKVFGDLQNDYHKFKDKSATYGASEHDMPYEKQEHFFNTSEFAFFHALNSSLDAHKYTVFPKVRLADFVKVTDKKSYWGAWNKIKSKHIDYLVWNLVESKVVMAIELDGNSHNGHSAEVSDEFKNNLYEKIGLPLVRIQVGSDFETEARIIAEQLG